MLRTVLYYKIYDMIFFQSIFKVHLQRKWRLWEQLKSTLQLTFKKKNASKEKENRKPKAFRHTGKWRRFHRNEHEQDAVITSKFQTFHVNVNVASLPLSSLINDK